jgi:hypothetical protein
LRVHQEKISYHQVATEHPLKSDLVTQAPIISPYYTDEIRLVCYELLDKGVSTKNIPEVIKFVLKSLASLEVDNFQNQHF